MAFRELKGFAREIFLETKIEQLKRIYRTSQKDLVRRLQSLDLTDFQKVRTEALLMQVNQEIAALDKLARNWTKTALPQAYNYGLDISEERLRALRVTKYVNYDSQIHRSAVNVLVDDVTLDLLTANQTIKKNVTRYIRMSQQKILEDKQISKLVAEGIIEGSTRREISGRLLDEFKKRLGDESLITINGRNYRPDAYSRMVARARFTEASNQANVNAALQYGVDLVQVSVHSGSCDICNPFQGKIYSISGGDSQFPPLEDRPPYHPNCRHQLLPITRESLEDRGVLESSVRFSNSQDGKGVRNFKEFEEGVNV
jgi:hypothetical protein